MCHINKLLRKSKLNRGNSLFVCKDMLRSKSLTTKALKIKIIGTEYFGGTKKQDYVRDTVTKVFVTFVVAENSSKSDRMDLLSELDLLKKLKPHPNVIQLLGCLTKDVLRCKGGREFSELDYFCPACAK